MQLSIMSVDSFHQQMNRGAVAEVTLMSDSTKVIHSFLQGFYLVYLFIYYLLLVARHQQPYDVDHFFTLCVLPQSRRLITRSFNDTCYLINLFI